MPSSTPFGPGDEHIKDGWQFRVVADGPELVLQTVRDGEWIDGYTFAPEPVPLIEQAGELLATRFGLAGWTLEADGRLVAQ